MNREYYKNIVDAVANDDEDKLQETVKAVMLEKIRSRMGYASELREAGNVKITNNDVFVSGKKVGTVNIDDGSELVEFTDVDGKSKEFDDIEDFHKHLSSVFEASPATAVSVKDKALKRSSGNAGDGEDGDYTSHDPRAKHKDGRMENPSKHDHGHDDKSGTEFKKETKSSAAPSQHKDAAMEKPSGHDHGHDDDSGVNPKSHSDKSGNNPPDKEHDLRKSTHKDTRMDNPKKHDHGHDTTKDVKVAK